jgi:phosphonate transport system substrate-binding protein
MQGSVNFVSIKKRDIRLKLGNGNSNTACPNRSVPAPHMKSATTWSSSLWSHARSVAAGLLLLLFLTAPLHAGWRDDLKTFRVGIIAEDGAGQTVPGLSVLKRAYSQALGMPVEIFVARDYAALIDAQATSRVDYAIYSTTAYATAALLCSCIEPVVAPVGADGAIGIVSILVSRDDRLPSLVEIGTHRVAIAAQDNIAGSILPLSGLPSEGAALTGSEPYLVHAESASAAEAMLVGGSVDAIFGWAQVSSAGAIDRSSGTLGRLEAAGIDGTSLKVVWQSSLLRYGPHALRSGLDPDVRRIVVAFLTGMKDLYPDVYDLLDTDHGGGFVEVTAQEYAPAIDAVRHMSGEAASP